MSDFKHYPESIFKTKKYYASLQRKISHRVIERCYEDNFCPNADGTIDYYNENLGDWESLAGLQVDSYEEAEELFESNYPTIWREDETRIIMRRM